MGFLFKSKEEMELDLLIKHIESNMSNNYKDAAQSDFREFEELLDGLIAGGKLKGKKKERYESVRNSYHVKLKGYSHKDQKPFWT